MQFSPTTFHRSLNFKSFNFNFFSGKFIQNSGKGELGIYKSKFSHFIGGVVRYSREGFQDLDGEKQFSDSSDLVVEDTIFKYMDTETQESGEKAQQVIYSTVLTKVTNCFFYEVLCFTEGSVIYVNQARAFNGSIYINDVFNHTEPIYFYGNDCSPKDLGNGKVIKFEGTCIENTITTCIIEKCAFRKIVSKVNESYRTKGWGVSISSGNSSITTNSFMNIVDTDPTKTNLFMTVNTEFIPIPTGVTYNNVSYNNFTICNSYASGIAVVSNPVSLKTSISYIKFSNGTTDIGCLQIMYTADGIPVNVKKDSTIASNILFTNLRCKHPKSSYSAINIVSGILTLKDSTFHECSRAVYYKGDAENTITFSNCQADAGTFSTFKNGESAPPGVTKHDNINIGEFNLGDTFSQIPIMQNIKSMFETEQFTPSPKPSDLPTADNEHYFTPEELLGVGVWTSIAGVIIFFYFVFTIYLRCGQKPKFNVIGRMEDIEVSSDSGACAFICRKIKCQKDEYSDYSENSLDEDVEEKKDKAPHNQTQHGMRPRKMSSSSSGSSNSDYDESSQKKPKNSQRPTSKRAMDKPQPKKKSRFSSSSSSSGSSESAPKPKSKRKVSESSDSSY